MSLLVALDQSDVAPKVMEAIAPYLRRNATEAHLATIVQPGEVREAARGARSVIEPDRSGDLSGGRLPVGAVQRRRPAVTRSQAIQQLVDAHRAVLTHLASEHLAGLPTRTHVEVADDVPEAIVALADELGVDAIAIGTRDRGGLRRALLGSVAEDVIRKAHVPVFVVREGMRHPAGDESAGA